MNILNNRTFKLAANLLILQSVVNEVAFSWNLIDRDLTSSNGCTIILANFLLLAQTRFFSFVSIGSRHAQRFQRNDQIKRLLSASESRDGTSEKKVHQCPYKLAVSGGRRWHVIRLALTLETQALSCGAISSIGIEPRTLVLKPLSDS